MSGESDFPTPEQEVVKLLDECAEIRGMLKSLGAQLTRIEARVKRSFPAAAKKTRAGSNVMMKADGEILSGELAQSAFDKIVKTAAAGATDEAERALRAMSTQDLYAIAKEVGISFSSSKPSAKAMRDAISGKVRESILLSRHSVRSL